MVVFSVYAAVLARSAGGLRCVWIWFYGIVAVTFACVWGLDVETWAVIDVVCAAAVATSTLFLRSEPLGALARNPEWRVLFKQELIARETPETMNWKPDRYVKYCVRIAVRKYASRASRE
jgi:hypothetical protein